MADPVHCALCLRPGPPHWPLWPAERTVRSTRHREHLTPPGCACALWRLAPTNTPLSAAQYVTVTTVTASLRARVLCAVTLKTNANTDNAQECWSLWVRIKLNVRKQCCVDSEFIPTDRWQHTPGNGRLLQQTLLATYCHCSKFFLSVFFLKF